MDGLVDFLQNSWQQFYELKAIEQVSAFFGIVIPFAGMLFAYGQHLTRQLRLQREELHKLHELSENRREQIEALQRELKQKDKAIALLESQFPEQWLKQAAKERENGNEERAIRGLRQGFESLREPLSACCLDLAGHHFSLVSDYGSQHFAEAERLGQLAVLLRPNDEQTGLFLAEIKAVAAEGKYQSGNLPASDALWEEVEDFLQVGKDVDSIDAIGELARRHYEQGHYRLAVRLYRRAMQMSQRHFGPDFPITLDLLSWYAGSLSKVGHYSEALALNLELLADRERVYGPEHPDVAASLNNLAELYKAQGQYTRAEPLFQRALAIVEKALGPEHPDVAVHLNNLALLYEAQGQYAQAEPLVQRSLAIWEKALGPDHPNVVTALGNYAGLLRKLDRIAEAEAMEARAVAIQATPTQSTSPPA